MVGYVNATQRNARQRNVVERQSHTSIGEAIEDRIRTDVAELERRARRARERSAILGNARLVRADQLHAMFDEQYDI